MSVPSLQIPLQRVFPPDLIQTCIFYGICASLSPLRTRKNCPHPVRSPRAGPQRRVRFSREGEKLH